MSGLWVGIALLLSPLQTFPSPPTYEVTQMASLMDILRSVGFTGNALRIAYAVAMAESSGNARAHNPNAGTGDNSYGLFQINMLGAMGPERRRLYGLKSNEDLFDPYVNARIAFKMSGGGRNWKPWTTYTTGAYQKFLGGADVNVRNDDSGGGTVNDKGGTPAAQKKSSDELAEQYGFNEAFLNANPELKGLFNKAVKEQWADQKFLAELRETKWWQTRSQKERDFIVKKYGDPATATAEYKAAWVKIRQLANQMGVRETPENYKRFSTWAYLMAGKGWDESQLRDEIGKFVFFGENIWQGEGAEVQEKLRSYAWSMGVTMTDDWYADQTRAVIRGIASIQDYEDRIRREAKAKFSHWAKQIDAGQTVADLASPYMQSMSRLLELPPGSVTVFNPIISKALTAKDSTGMATVKPLWQFENELREDPRWRKTKNAQDSLMQVAHQVLADFGMKY